MAKFVHVDTVPPELQQGEFVIVKPNFLEEIQANAAKAPKSKLTGPNQLRYIVDTIGMKYDPEGTNGWSIRPHMYEGRPYKTNEELSDIVVHMLEAQHPALFKRVVEYNLKRLPPATKTVYLVNFTNPEAVSALTENGFTEATTDDISDL